jgi:NAD(P)-dependent dehydrogenase (short-subunit alcohol dehydrogenase family)
MRAYAGKVVVITGAAGGLGAALCRHFAAAGAHVAALDLDAARAAALAAALAASGTQAIGLRCDVTSESSVAEAMAGVMARFGGVDVLVNNAGISHRSYFKDTDPKVIRRVMDVNFFGAVYATKAALASLLERRGQILAVSSIAGFSPLLERTGYSASKHALHGFFDSLRAEVAEQGVSVVVVCPSFVATGIDASALAGDGGQVAVPRKTVGKEVSPDEMAARIVAAARAEETLSLPTGLSRLSWWVSHLAPRVFVRQMKKRVSID